jgi:hypothetical protein
MSHDPKKPKPKSEDGRNADGSILQPPDQQAGDGVRDRETTPAQERGERIDTGKSIARGGTDEGKVPGAEQEPRH